MVKYTHCARWSYGLYIVNVSRNIETEWKLGQLQYSYSQGISIEKPNKIVFVAEQVSLDKEGKLVGKDDIVQQTEQAVKNVERVLRDGVYVWRHRQVKHLRETRRGLFQGHRGKKEDLGSSKNFPASTLVQVKSLAYSDILVEVEAIAVK